ncbi:S-adenosyl-L-methionine-dependent methyltransferase [Phaeosphaeriaceae sp. PMI808]|nr:S-adenosyl-L-methionine-dependent methyltransferase [Phaeosphaeriaceae sp. PMI808]
MATQQNSGGGKSTQNTQYDKIGTKYNVMTTLPSVEPEEPSVIKALGSVEGKRCLDLACGTGRRTHLLARLGAASVVGYDISSSMIDGAKSTYPSNENSHLTFEVRDCSIPEKMKHDEKFDIVFAGWFLNYAGTEAELINMFRVIEQNLVDGGRFLGVTTNVYEKVTEPKMDFYGLDILVLDPAYVAPDTNQEVGITARVVVKSGAPFSFDVFQFRKEVYERCAQQAGLLLKWHDIVLPEDERMNQGYWDLFLERPAFTVIEAVKA